MAIDVERSLAKMAAKREELTGMPHDYAGADVKGEIEQAIAEQFQAEVRTLVSLAMRETYTEDTELDS